MDSEIMYSMFAIIALVGIAILTLRSGKEESQVKSKEQKRMEIINGYKKSIQDALRKLDDQDEKKIDTKRLLLKKYSEELAQNIFFDKEDIREVIAELARE